MPVKSIGLLTGPLPLVLVVQLLVAGAVLLLASRLFSAGEADAVPVVGQARAVEAATPFRRQRPRGLGVTL